MNAVEKDNPYLIDELLIVRHSGEIPEVALHGSLYYLTQDPEGPGLELGHLEVRMLKNMVVERYREIIHRDLEPANRDLGLYRGMVRAQVNWRRLSDFCRKEGMDLDEDRREIGRVLLGFIRREAEDVKTGHRRSSISGSSADLQAFALEVGLDPAKLPTGWERLCASIGG